MGTNGLWEMQGFETQRHRGHREGEESAGGGDGIALRVARMLGVSHRCWLGLRGIENRRECNLG